jgi:hypothetical protein
VVRPVSYVSRSPPELFLLPGDYNSATRKKAVVSLESVGYSSGEARRPTRVALAAARNRADSQIKSTHEKLCISRRPAVFCSDAAFPR